MERHKRLNINYDNSEFSVNLLVDSGTLKIAIEDCRSPKLWFGEFTEAEIENMTKRTCMYKKSSVFTKMLFSESPSVRFLLLKSEDLARSDSRPKDVMYLIVSYENEFDQTNYPLPASLQTSSFVNMLQKARIYNQETQNSQNDNSNHLLKERDYYQNESNFYWNENRTMREMIRKDREMIFNLQAELKQIKQTIEQKNELDLEKKLERINSLIHKY